jgi:predicted transcriptional regulator
MDSTKKLELLDLLMHEQDDNILRDIYTILKRPLTAWENEASPELVAAIKKGMEEANNGKLRSHSEVWTELLAKTRNKA